MRRLYLEETEKFRSRGFDKEEMALWWYERFHEREDALRDLQSENKRLKDNCEELRTSLSAAQTQKDREIETREQENHKHQISLRELKHRAEQADKRYHQAVRRHQAILNESRREAEQERSQHMQEQRQLRSNLAQEQRQTEGEREQHRQEKREMESKFNELKEKHVLSINNVGTGLHPIANQTFANAFRAIHDQVN
jgi:predicted  nucleic acid-binding Zn-ribbon protein